MNKLLNLSRRASYDEDIIHIDKYIERVTNLKLKKERVVNFGRMKTKLMQQQVETFKPCPRGLLKAIQSTVKFTHLVRMSNVNKPRRLAHIYVFLKNDIEKCIVKIKLSHGSVIGDGKSKHHPNGSRFDHRTICIMKIKIQNSVESFGHQPGLIFVHRIIKVYCDFEGPFTSHNLMI